MSFAIGARPWADCVFHVLAQVPSAVPASLYDPAYVAFSEKHLGPASARTLGEDIGVLGAFANDHARYAALQGLAWLFETPKDDAVRTDLAELAPEDVTDRALFAALVALGPEVEVLRCAVELERPHHARLPNVEYETNALEGALSEAARAAPSLREFRIGVVRSLGLRGRVRGDEIWIGVPDSVAWRGRLRPSYAHCAWQAAHEATVAELARTMRRTGDDRPLEHAALRLLSERASRAGLAAEHASWFSHFSEPL